MALWSAHSGSRMEYGTCLESSRQSGSHECSSSFANYACEATSIDLQKLWTIAKLEDDVSADEVDWV